QVKENACIVRKIDNYYRKSIVYMERYHYQYNKLHTNTKMVENLVSYFTHNSGLDPGAGESQPEPEKVNRSRRKSTGAGESQPEPEKVTRSRRKSTGAGEGQQEPEEVNRIRRKYIGA